MVVNHLLFADDKHVFGPITP